MIKPKILMAIALPILLVAGGSWYYFAQPVPRLEVKEDTAILVLHHIAPGTSTWGNITTYGVTHVNNNSKLEVGVSAYEIDRGGGSEHVLLDIYVIGNFSSDININALKICAKMVGNVSKNGVDFLTSGNRESGLKVWPVDRIVPGAVGNATCFLGYNVYSHNFQASTQILWEILGAKNDTTYGLIITAIAHVSSEKIPVTLNVVVEGR